MSFVPTFESPLRQSAGPSVVDNELSNGVIPSGMAKASAQLSFSAHEARARSAHAELHSLLQHVEFCEQTALQHSSVSQPTPACGETQSPAPPRHAQNMLPQSFPRKKRPPRPPTQPDSVIPSVQLVPVQQAPKQTSLQTWPSSHVPDEQAGSVTASVQVSDSQQAPLQDLVAQFEPSRKTPPRLAHVPAV